MPTQKQILIQELEQKKSMLKELQDKCELQNVKILLLKKKIKLFRKENEELTAMIEERQQVDTNLLLNSKELLAHNSRMEKTIEELREQLEVAKNNHAKMGAQNNNNTDSQGQVGGSMIKRKATTISLREITVTDQTQQIDLPEVQLTDDQILQLDVFVGLKVLIVNKNLLGNAGVAMICGNLVNLQKLDLADNKFTAEGLENVGSLKGLKFLDIRNNSLGDDAIKHISEVKSLGDLSCSKNSLTDVTGKYLEKLTNLTYLDITNNQLTSDSVKHIKVLEKVIHLYLMSNRLNKEGIIEMMRSMKGLQFLDVRFNVWTNDEKQEIRKEKTQKLQVFC